MITENELAFVREALRMAQDAGAQHARATLSKSEEDLVATLDGEVDRVTHCADRSLSLALFVDGRFGSFSTNKLDPAALEGFIARAVAATRMVAEDPCRTLPDPARCCHDALTGDELGLVDPSRASLSPADRRQLALNASVLYNSRGGSEPLQNFASNYSQRATASENVLLRRTPPTSCGSGPLPLTEPRVATVFRGSCRIPERIRGVRGGVCEDCDAGEYGRGDRGGAGEGAEAGGAGSA